MKRPLLGVLGFVLTTCAACAAGRSGRTSVLFTNDTHAHIDDGAVTFSQIAAYRDRLERDGESTILVDCGDVIQGTACGKIDAGASLIDLMNEAGYQVGTLGNHEFDHGLKAAIDRAKTACRFPVVACNFWETNLVKRTREPVLPAYAVVTTATAHVAFVGVVTPESLTFSVPRNFMDETGSYYRYGFEGGADGSGLYASVQRAVDEAAKAADAVVVIGHLGVGESSAPWRSVDVIANTTNYVAFLDGHSHSLVDREVMNAAGVPVRLMQSGSHLKAFGVLVLEGGRVAKTEIVSSLPEAANAAVRAKERSLVARVEQWLGEKLAVVDEMMTRYRAEPATCGETSLGDFVTDAMYWYANERRTEGCDLALSNYAGIRANVAVGDFKLRTASDVCPFGNGVCLLEMKGSEIRDALEWGARRFPGYVGGFLHCAGLKYAIDPSLPSTVRSRDGIWTGGPSNGVYRVKAIEVYDRRRGGFVPLELTKTYRVAGCDYTLRNCGEGYEMLRACKAVDERLETDYVVLGEYARAFRRGEDGWPHLASAFSPLAALVGYPLDYAEPTGSGRIRAIPGKNEVK